MASTRSLAGRLTLKNYGEGLWPNRALRVTMIPQWAWKAEYGTKRIIFKP
jgi:hypothetical protein